MAGEIRIVGPTVHRGVLTRLNLGCETFREELEPQLCWLLGTQGELADGAHQLANVSDSKLVQNPQRNDRQD